MKVRELIRALSNGDMEQEVFCQRSERDGYFALYAIQPEGHIGANGFVLHIFQPEEQVCARKD